MTTPNCELLQSMRSILLRNSIQPTRLEIVSPYTNTTPSESTTSAPLYTKKQLDMRRKYEILQYKNNGSVNGKRTKSAAYSSLMSNNRNRYTITVPENNNVVVYSSTSCPDDNNIAVPTTASDVPGKKELLYYEPDVPLYNFGYNIPDYGILPKSFDLLKIAQIVSNINILLSSETLTNIITILFSFDSGTGIKTLLISLPLEISIAGQSINPEESSIYKIQDFIIGVFQGTQPISISDIITTFDKTTVEIDDYDFDGNFSVTDNFVVNIEIPLAVSPETTFTIGVQPILEIINFNPTSTEIIANSEGDAQELNVNLD